MVSNELTGFWKEIVYKGKLDGGFGIKEFTLLQSGVTR